MLLLQYVGAGVLGLMGLWLGNSYRRKVRSDTTTLLLGCYVTLWEVTGRVGSPEVREPMTERARLELSADLDRWYFEKGAGLILPWRTRELFFFIRNNLRRPRSEILPASLASAIVQLSDLDADLRHSCVLRRQLSLLRSQMKADLALYRTDQHLKRRPADEREVLKMCHLYRPTLALIGRLPLAGSRTARTTCACGMCVAGTATINPATPALVTAVSAGVVVDGTNLVGNGTG